AKPPPKIPPTVPQPDDRNTCSAGSVIECENQILGEDLSLAGTPFSLHYRSDRVIGYPNNTVVIPVLDPSDPPPASLWGIEVMVDIAGQRWRSAVPRPYPSVVRYLWDGRDGDGRPVQGSMPAVVTVDYIYHSTYEQTNTFGYAGNGNQIL